MIRLKQMAPFAIALLLVLSSEQGQAQTEPTLPAHTRDPISPVIFNNPPPPPETGRPGRRSDAGSRGCGEEESSSSSEPIPLLALVPTQTTATGSTIVFGQTAAEYPTFWFYVPYHSSLTATFVLQDQDGNSIYESEVVLPQTSGVMGLKLPTTVPPLEMGKPYHWFFKLYCGSVSPPTSFVDGWIQRASLPPDLAQQRQTASLQQQIQLYAASGFWFEALTIAAELHQTPSETSAWAELLRTIGLETVAGEAIALP